jgi:hypothetical protein
MGRAWSKSGVPEGSSLFTETFGAKICRPSGRRLHDSRSSQGQTHRSIPGPCSWRRAVSLQIKGSHSSGKGQAAHRAYPLQSQRGSGQESNHLRGSSKYILKSVVRPQDCMLRLDVESVFFHVPIHPKYRKVFSSHLALPLFVNNKFIDLQSVGYFVCTRPDLAPLVPSTQTPSHL